MSTNVILKDELTEERAYVKNHWDGLYIGKGITKNFQDHQEKCKKLNAT